MDDWMTGKKLSVWLSWGFCRSWLELGALECFKNSEIDWHGNFLWAKKILSLEEKVVIYIYVQ